MSDSWIQVITIIGSNLLIMLTFFGVTISLHNGIREELRGIQEEIKDFHGRLERQDADFKAHMLHLHGDKNSNL